jgi:hypothetical protein
VNLLNQIKTSITEHYVPGLDTFGNKYVKLGSNRIIVALETVASRKCYWCLD